MAPYWMRQAYLALGAILLLMLAALHFWLPVTTGKYGPVGLDFGALYLCATYANAGDDPYKTVVVRPKDPPSADIPIVSAIPINLNAPFLTAALQPLADYPFPISLILWTFASLSIGTFCVYLLVKLYLQPKDFWPSFVGWWAAYWSYYPTFMNTHFGQVGAWLLLLQTLMFVAYRLGYLAAAGTALGVALAIKPLFGLFGIFFLIRKQWSVLFWSIITFAACNMLALALLGKTPFISYIHSLPYVHWFASTHNASLYGFLHRIFWAFGETSVPLWKAPLLGKVIYALISTTCIAQWALITWRSHTPLSEDLAFALTVVLTLLISPLAWVYYFPLLLVPAVIWMHALNQHTHPNRGWIIFSAALFLTNLPFEMLSGGCVQGIIPIFLMGGVDFYGLLIAGGSLLVLWYFAQIHGPAKAIGPLISEETRGWLFGAILAIAPLCMANHNPDTTKVAQENPVWPPKGLCYYGIFRKDLLDQAEQNAKTTYGFCPLHIKHAHA